MIHCNIFNEHREKQINICVSEPLPRSIPFHRSFLGFSYSHLLGIMPDSMWSGINNYFALDEHELIDCNRIKPKVLMFFFRFQFGSRFSIKNLFSATQSVQFFSQAASHSWCVFSHRRLFHWVHLIVLVLIRYYEYDISIPRLFNDKITQRLNIKQKKNNVIHWLACFIHRLF